MVGRFSEGSDMVESPGFHAVGEKWKQGDQLEGDCNGPGEEVVA